MSLALRHAFIAAALLAFLNVPAVAAGTAGGSAGGSAGAGAGAGGSMGAASGAASGSSSMGAASGNTAGTTGSTSSSMGAASGTTANGVPATTANPGVSTIQNNTTVPAGSVSNNAGVGTIQNNTTVPTGTAPNNVGVGTIQNNTTVPGNATMTQTSGQQSTNHPRTANWNAENQYWETHFSTRPYFTSSAMYSSYQPAYQYGVTLFNQNKGQPFNTLTEAQLRAGWAQAHGSSDLSWDQAQVAARDAYMRLYNGPNAPTGVTVTP